MPVSFSDLTAAVANLSDSDRSFAESMLSGWRRYGSIVWEVLEGAKDAGDTMVRDACRRLITAHRLGWRKYADPADYALVLSFHD